MLMDKQTKNGQMNRRKYTIFESNLAMMVIYLPFKSEFDWTKWFELESGNENVDGQKTDKRTDTNTPILKAT